MLDCGEVCCDGLYQLVSEVVTVAFDAVVECAGLECCDGFVKFVSVNEPHHMTQSYVAGWLAETNLVDTASTGSSKMLALADQRVATVNIKLMERGYPTIVGLPSGSESFEPTAEAIDRAAQHSMSHGMSAHNAVRQWLKADSAICSVVRQYQPMRPSGPSGGLVGWIFGFQVVVR